MSYQFPHIHIFGDLAYKVLNSETVAKLTPSGDFGMVVEYDGNGKPLQTWQSTLGEVRHVCEGFLHTDGYIYLGSPWAPRVYRVKY